MCNCKIEHCHALIAPLGWSAIRGRVFSARTTALRTKRTLATTKICRVEARIKPLQVFEASRGLQKCGLGYPFRLHIIPIAANDFRGTAHERLESIFGSSILQGRTCSFCTSGPLAA